MRLLGNDFWDDVVDINDKHKKRKKDWSAPTSASTKDSAGSIDKKGVPGITIFYRVLGTVLLVSTMIKSWFWTATVFDWALIIISLILIGVHRRLGAYYVIERVKPAFLDLHERLAEVELKINDEITPDTDDVKK